jgi:transposase
VVQEYLNGEGGYRYLTKVHAIKNMKQIETWVNSYREFGEEGLLRKRKNRTYSIQFKMDAIELYQTSELSYREVPNVLEINNPALIANWMRKFREDGIEGLSKMKGRPPTLDEKKNRKRDLLLKQHRKNENVLKNWKNKFVLSRLKMPF